VALLSIVAAALLLGVHGVRLVHAGTGLTWWLIPLWLTGMIVADFLSGIVHWGADTWGKETMPVLGKRLLRPFRVHHINPGDFLTRHWIDTNGDVATIVSVVLTVALAIPLESVSGQAFAVFVLAVAATTLPTNQVHQWAHMTSPPRLVRVLQRFRILMSHSHHAEHHAPPYVSNYCIALGWCNRVLVRLRFFSRAERLVTRLTGAMPRADETSVFESRSRFAE
jgi:ubiquitin-conjugating enzyme E2 variant